MRARTQRVNLTILPTRTCRNPGRFPCIQPGGAAFHHIDRLRTVQSVYGSKPMILSEFGWPGPDFPVRDPAADPKCGDQGGSVATRDAKYFVAVSTLQGCRDSGNLPCIPFESYNEPWKEKTEGLFGSTLGFCSPDYAYGCELPNI